MRNPNSPRSFGDFTEEIEAVASQLKHPTKRRARMILFREMRILLKEVDIELGYLARPEYGPV